MSSNGESLVIVWLKVVPVLRPSKKRIRINDHAVGGSHEAELFSGGPHASTPGLLAQNKFEGSVPRTRSWHAVADDPAPVHCIIRPACLSPLAQSWAHTKFNQSSDRVAWARFTAPVTRVSIARSL